MTEGMQKVLESERAMRTRLATLPFSEKLVLLERMRERHIAVSSSGLKRRNHQSGRRGNG
jgi:hypothetical protein